MDMEKEKASFFGTSLVTSLGTSLGTSPVKEEEEGVISTEG